MKLLSLSSIALTIALVGCAPADNPSETVTIGGPRNIAMLVLIAEERGYFEAEGVDVEFMPLQTGKIAQDALVTGDIDIGVLVEANIAFVRFQGDNDIRIFTSIQEKYDDALVVRRDRGIESAEDLRGRTIGYLPATTSHVFLSRFLESRGIAESEVTLLTMPPPAMQAAIINGEVDAVSVWQPFRYNALATLGEAAAELNDPDVYLARAVLAADAGFLEDRSQDVEGILAALIRAEQYLETDEAEAQAYLSEAVGIAESALREAWDEYTIRVRLDQDLVDLIQEEGEWIATTNPDFIGQPVPDYTNAIAPDPLRSVAADRVLVP